MILFFLTIILFCKHYLSFGLYYSIVPITQAYGYCFSRINVRYEKIHLEKKEKEIAYKLSTISKLPERPDTMFYEQEVRAEK